MSTSCRILRHGKDLSATTVAKCYVGMTERYNRREYTVRLLILQCDSNVRKFDTSEGGILAGSGLLATDRTSFE